eukprot:1320822-Amorphochlora_amoeboformis.AAC.1
MSSEEKKTFVPVHLEYKAGVGGKMIPRMLSSFPHLHVESDVDLEILDLDLEFPDLSGGAKEQITPPGPNEHKHIVAEIKEQPSMSVKKKKRS